MDNNVYCTMDTYIADAKDIWNDLRLKLKETRFRSMSLEHQLDHYQKNNIRFANAFPIVLRYMVQLRMYHEKAFIRFIKKMQSKPYHSKLEFCERQADYVKYLYQELNTHYPENEAKRIWKETYDMLAKEVKMFEDAEKTVKEKLEKNEIINNKEKREELKKLLQNKLNAM